MEQLEPNCTCSMRPEVSALFHHLHICNLPLVPSWVLAVVIGIVGGLRLKQLGPSIPGSLTYSFTYFTYAVMITSGLIVHCLFLVECGAAPVTEGYIIFAYVDASLTACIAISFAFNGLVDLGIINERKPYSVCMMEISYVAIFYISFSKLVKTATLYNGSIIIGCSIYLLCELVMLVRKKIKMCPVWYLITAGVTGGISFLLFSRYSCLLCTEFGAWSVEGIWYYGSDITMVFLLLYILATREHATAVATSTAPTTSPLPTHITDEIDSDENWVPDNMKCSNSALNRIERIMFKKRPNKL